MADIQHPTVEIDTEEFDINQCFKNGKKLYLNEAKADVNFTFGAGGKKVKRIPAHRAILAGNSDVFDTMFYGDLKETGDVDVPDSTEAAFMEFLQYFYLSKAKLTAENVAGVLHLGEKYDVKKCVDDCVRFLVRRLSNKNVCAYLGLAILYGNEQLMEVCEKKMLLDTDAVFDSDGFLYCDKSVLTHILKMDVLSCAEDEVFKACMAWVKVKSGGVDPTIELVERHLGELDQYIRFASLTMDQLCALQEQYESVLTRDFIGISKIIVLPEPGALKRHAKWNADAIIKCDRRIGPPTSAHELDSDSNDDLIGQFEDFNEKEKSVFTTNKAILLGSLSCNEIFICSDDPVPCDRLTVEMAIAKSNSRFDDDDPNEKILLTMKIVLKSIGTNISFPHPILIRPGFFYKIRFGPFPGQHLYYAKYQKDKIELGSDIVIQFSNCDQTAFIPVLNFNKI